MTELLALTPESRGVTAGRQGQAGGAPERSKDRGVYLQC